MTTERPRRPARKRARELVAIVLVERANLNVFHRRSCRSLSEHRTRQSRVAASSTAGSIVCESGHGRPERSLSPARPPPESASSAGGAIGEVLPSARVAVPQLSIFAGLRDPVTDRTACREIRSGGLAALLDGLRCRQRSAWSTESVSSLRPARRRLGGWGSAASSHTATFTAGRQRYTAKPCRGRADPAGRRTSTSIRHRVPEGVVSR